MNEQVTRTSSTATSQLQSDLHTAADLRPLLEPVAQFVARRPAVSLASAFALGVALAWWIKRK